VGNDENRKGFLGTAVCKNGEIRVQSEIRYHHGKVNSDEGKDMGEKSWLRLSWGEGWDFYNLGGEKGELMHGGKGSDLGEKG